MQAETKKDIKSLTLPELEAELASLGEKKYRAKQVYKWLHRGVRGFEEMTDLSLSLREKLDANYYVTAPELLRKQVSAEDGTVKYLWGLRDGNNVETVLMRYDYGCTVCVSTQVGCRMGCAFCASTLGGLVRNMEPSEILDEVLFSEKDSGLTVSNIVLMGIGEPLDNFDRVMRFLELVNSPEGRNIGMRHISLSTCGLTDGIDKLAEHNVQLTLSVSLHAPDDETRSRIMPVNRAHGVDELMAACARYFETTGRRISFEYAMIDGVNDTERHAALLAKRARKLGAHVNLIRLNHVEERELSPSTEENMKRFLSVLRGEGVNVTVRRRLGGDVDASCGQLRRRAALETSAEN